MQLGREWGLHARRVEVFGPPDKNIIHLTFLPSLTPINHNKCHQIYVINDSHLSYSFGIIVFLGQDSGD